MHIESLNTGWRDKDDVLLHASFQILKNCIEKENLLNDNIDWNADDKHKDARAELIALYEWWLSHVEKDDGVSTPGPEQYVEQDEMLIRLIRVRWALWT